MALTAMNLAFTHPGGEPLYRAANLRIEPGHVVGLTGPSGSGKSTLGALIAGDLHPRSRPPCSPITQARIWHMFLDIVRERRLGLLVISHEQSLLDRVCEEQITVESLRS